MKTKIRIIWYLASVALLLLLNADSSFATSQSIHKYWCIGKNYGNDGIIWLRDSAGGAYDEYDQLGIIIPKENEPIFIRTLISSELINPLIATSHWEPMEELHDSGGVFYSDSGLVVTPPEYNAIFDTVLMQLMRDSILDHAGEIISIGARYPPDLPTVNSSIVKFIWSHPGGLYKNYKFKHVYWFTRSQMLVVCTDQPRQGVGEDTMHGVLVLKVAANETKKK